MARENFTIEKGLRISAENDDTIFVDFLFGSAAPGSAAQENNASVGSVYLRTNGTLYVKTTAGSGTDKWTSQVTEAALKYRGNAVVLTDDADPGAGAYTGPFGDDDGSAPAIDNTGFAVNDRIIFDADGTPVLYYVSATSGSDITLTADPDTLVAGDLFTVQYYLPDSPAAQEGAALAAFNGTIVEKIGDVNWNFADGINMAAGYTAGSGNPSASDTVQTAIQKIDGNVDAIDTRQGLTQGATSFGATAGAKNVLGQNETAKGLFEDIEAEIDTYKTQAGVTSGVVLDSVPIASYEAVEWLVHQELDGTPTNRKISRVLALHNGATGAADVEDKVKVGANFSTGLSVAVSGGNLELTVSASAATTFKSHRRHVLAAIN